MIRDKNILHAARLLVGESIVDVLRDFCLLLLFQFRIIRKVCLLLNKMADLDLLKTNSNIPLVEILVVLILLIEGRNGNLSAPEGCVREAGGFVDALVPEVFNSHLIVGRAAEGPDLVLVASVVDERVIVLRWVRVQ